MGISIYKAAAEEDAVDANECLWRAKGAECGILRRGPNLHPSTPSLCNTPSTHLQQHSQLHKFKFMCATPEKQDTGRLPNVRSFSSRCPVRFQAFMNGQCERQYRGVVTRTHFGARFQMNLTYICSPSEVTWENSLLLTLPWPSFPLLTGL